MSKHEANAKVLGYLGPSDEKEVEFFFYSPSQNDASNLAIELNRLGYKISGVDNSCSEKDWCVSGWTGKMKMDEKSINEWTDRMDNLALEHNSVFDGWGTFADDKPIIEE